jgi:hypothetical protein
MCCISNERTEDVLVNSIVITDWVRYDLHRFNNPPVLFWASLKRKKEKDIVTSKNFACAIER